MAATISSLRLSGFLSFGPTSEAVELGKLNVFIGPNASGKSNFIEALDLLRSAPLDLPLPIRTGGGVLEWLWAGADGAPSTTSTLEGVFAPGAAAPPKAPALRYRLTFGSEGGRFVVVDERLENALPAKGHTKPYFYFGYERGVPYLNLGTPEARQLRREDLDRTQSIVSQRNDPDLYPELHRLARQLKAIHLYRSWSFGPEALVRQPCSPDQPSDRLSEKLDNLGVRLAALKQSSAPHERLLAWVRGIGEGITDIQVKEEWGRQQVYVTEGDHAFPARRLSDGTLRMLCLGAILIDPPKDSVVVIEEPELGLHPDLMPMIRDLLLEASQTAQIIITTHSTVLADAFTDHADCVLVTEKQEMSTTLSRLSQEDVDRWRKQGGLGRLWMSGRLGGTRW